MKTNIQKAVKHMHLSHTVTDAGNFLQADVKVNRLGQYLAFIVKSEIDATIRNTDN
jgi:hypothetical protein